MHRRIKLKTLNEHIVCKICKGYLIEATTVTEFCKSCIVKHLEEKNTCPNCHIIIHQSHPLHYISYDRTLQDIVYKLVPNLQKNEIEREKEFYLSRVLPYPRLNGENNTPQDVNSNPSADLNSNSFNYHRDDEQIGVELISFSESHLKQVKTRYIKCSSQLTITQMKKIISLMLFKTCDKHHNIDLFYNEELLGKDHTLKFVFVTRWRFKRGPLKLYYRPSYQLLSYK
ncbi:Polycomb group RING finger protein 3 [Sarcoptes scabiei]|nr:Polycomb group RING finger protein 3 [Sarcoptes scabiei]